MFYSGARKKLALWLRNERGEVKEVIATVPELLDCLVYVWIMDGVISLLNYPYDDVE